ncbi:YgjV family protein [Ferrimonas gelatinilytica]|uniref:Inner membrane protein n=1 Tax=Ferrimonas gelatinilytica TaxID=1255257 RepID=A0ABP9RXA3_9GAMM
MSDLAPLFAQALGFVAMAVGWWAAAQRCDQRLLRGNLLSAVLTAGHLGGLGSSLGMSNQLVNAARFGLAQRVRHRRWAHLFAGVALLQGLALAQRPAEWCVVLGSVLSSYLLFCCRGDLLRWGLVGVNLLNLTLSVTLLSWSGILYQSVTLTLLLRSLLKPRPTPISI